jgi:hypothetical protein
VTEREWVKDRRLLAMLTDMGDEDTFPVESRDDALLYVGLGELHVSLTLPSGRLSKEFLAQYELSHPDWPESEDDFEPSEAELKWRADANAAFELAVRSEMAAATGHDGWTTNEPFAYVGMAAGIPPGDVVTLLLDQAGNIDKIVTWISAVGFLVQAMKYLRERYGEEPTVDDGAALVIASQAIFEESGDNDLTVAFSVGLNPRSQGEDEEWIDMPDGYLVGFRGDNRLWTAVVALNGDVLAVQSQPLADALPTWWRERRRQRRERDEALPPE